MADIDVVLQSGAREFYDDVATATERSLINQALADLSENPSPDGRTKHRLPASMLYRDQRLWILYEMLNAFTISVLGIGTVE